MPPAPPDDPPAAGQPASRPPDPQVTAPAADLAALIAGLFSPLAHALRAGLNGISVWTHLLSRDGDDVSARALEGIRRAVTHQSALAQDLSQFGAVLGAQGAEPTARVDLRAVCTQVIEEAGEAAVAQCLHLREGEPLAVLAHPALLKQAVRMLLLDALAAVPDGTPVDVRLRSEDGEGVLEIGAASRTGGSPRRATLRQALCALAAGILGGRLLIVPGEPAPRCILHLPAAA